MAQKKKHEPSELELYYLPSREPQEALIARLRDNNFDNLAQKLAVILFLKDGCSCKSSYLADLQDVDDSVVRHQVYTARHLISDLHPLVSKDRITFSALRTIAHLPPDQQEKAARDMLAKRMSVTKLRNYLSGSDSNSTDYVRQLSDSISDQSGFSASISIEDTKSNGGKLSFSFCGLDDFENLLSRLNIKLPE